MTHIDFKEAQEAYRKLKAGGKVPSGWPETRTLDQFFGLPSTDMYGRAIPPPQVARPLVENRHQAMMTGPDCPDPVPWGSDEYKCPRCGRIWDRDEQRPDCN